MAGLPSLLTFVPSSDLSVLTQATGLELLLDPWGLEAFEFPRN